MDVGAGTATLRDYWKTVTGALGVQPVWDGADAWTGRFPAARARAWGWRPAVGLPEALEKIARGLR